MLGRKRENLGYEQIFFHGSAPWNVNGTILRVVLSVRYSFSGASAYCVCKRFETSLISVVTMRKLYLESQ